MKIFATVGLLLASSLILVAAATTCSPPPSAEFCSRVRIACLDVEKDKCENDGGMYLERAGVCGYCTLCAEYVGEGATCNTTITSQYTTPICQPPLQCTGRDGKCVKKCTRYVNGTS